MSRASTMGLALALLAMLVGPSLAVRTKPKAKPVACDLVGVANKLKATTFVQLITETGLAKEVLKPSFTGTIFVPTNEALAAATKAYPNTTPEQILDILLYHAATKPYGASALIKAKGASTYLKPQKIKVAVRKGKVNIIGVGSTATVLKADLCPAGAKVQVHSIDTVLLPKL